MTVEFLFDQVDLQGEKKIVYVEEDGYERIEVDYDRAKACEIEYMYCDDDNILYIEVSMPGEA